MTSAENLPDWRPPAPPTVPQPVSVPDPAGLTGILHQQIALAGMRGWWFISADTRVATMGSGTVQLPRRLIIRVDDTGQVSYQEISPAVRQTPQWLIAAVLIGIFVIFAVLVIASAANR